MFQVELSRQATRFFERADAPLQRRLDRCFDLLKHEPRHHPNIKPLSGKYRGLFRFRVGDYRVIFRIEHAQRLVIVLVIGHRRDVYA